MQVQAKKTLGLAVITSDYMTKFNLRSAVPARFPIFLKFISAFRDSELHTSVTCTVFSSAPGPTL